LGRPEIQECGAKIDKMIEIMSAIKVFLYFLPFVLGRRREKLGDYVFHFGLDEEQKRESKSKSETEAKRRRKKFDNIHYLPRNIERERETRVEKGKSEAKEEERRRNIV
jgi:hypothetical protein